VLNSNKVAYGFVYALCGLAMSLMTYLSLQNGQGVPWLVLAVFAILLYLFWRATRFNESQVRKAAEMREEAASKESSESDSTS
jgi:hypothetical protein